MFLGYGFCVIAAILVGSLAALMHSSGHAPIGLVSVGVGLVLGAILSAIAVWRRLPRNRLFVKWTVGLALLTLFFEHDCLYIDFCRQWREAREKSPQIAMFRDENPWSFAEYFAHEYTPQRALLWALDAVLIAASAVGTVYILRRSHTVFGVAADANQNTDT